MKQTIFILMIFLIDIILIFLAPEKIEAKDQNKYDSIFFISLIITVLLITYSEKIVSLI